MSTKNTLSTKNMLSTKKSGGRDTHPRARFAAGFGVAALVAGLMTVQPSLAAAATSQPAAQPTANQPYQLVDGETAAVYDYGNAIRETVWVSTPDLDGDGAPERIAADIIRPRELDGTARVPVVMDASPYYLSLGRGNESEFKQYDADGNPIKFPLYYDNFFVPRGYAFVAVDMAGTGRSTGCTDEGGVSDVESVKAVVEWLDGKGVAYDANGKTVSATWSSGKTGMIGKSYDGTLANGVAAAGTQGLTTIVPISAISSWYDYNRWQGAVKSAHYPSSLSRSIAANRTVKTDCSARLAYMDANDGDATGAYTDFWAERDYRQGTTYDASKVKASVFIVHGLQDNNVKTMNMSKWWADLGEHGVTRKMWLTRLGHVDPFDARRTEWVDTLHRWFDHELMGVENGILGEPAVSVETGPNHWEQSSTWPIPAAHTVALNPQADGTLKLSRPADATASYTNNSRLSETNAIKVGDSAERLLYLTDATTSDIRISGTPTVDLDVTHTSAVGQVSVMLVDYGEMDRVSASNDGALTLTTESCWGPATATDDACYKDVSERIERSQLQVLARGWARLDGAGAQQLTVELAANDVLVPAGHRLGLVVSGASNGVRAVDSTSSAYTVNLRNTRLNLPMAGSLGDAGGTLQVITADVAGSALTLRQEVTTPVAMTPVTLTGVDQITDGTLHPVTVLDARGTSAGWNLTGQVSDFTSATGTILADNLGWKPSASTRQGQLPTAPASASEVTTGAEVAPGSGLGSAKTLCGALKNHSAGAFDCGGGLRLGIPGATTLGTYSAVLTLTLI